MIRFTEFNISEFCFVEIQFYKLSLKDLWMFNDERNLNRANSQLAKIQILQIFFQYIIIIKFIFETLYKIVHKAMISKRCTHKIK